MSKWNGQHQAEDGTADLAAEVHELRDEMRVLREAIDEFRELLEWISRNPEQGSSAVDLFRQVVSMPLDPTARDFAERLNRFRPEDLPPAEPDVEAVEAPGDKEGIEAASDDPLIDGLIETEEPPSGDDPSHQGRLFNGNTTEPAETPAALLRHDREENFDDSPDADRVTARKEEGNVEPVDLEQLASRLLACLRLAAHPVEIRELRRQLGFPNGDARDPLANPINRLLAELRTAGTVMCHESDWGEPSFSMPVTEPEQEGNGAAPEPESIEPYILIEFSDEEVAAFRMDGTWLACEATRAEAIREANSVLIAATNETPWGLDSIESGRGHLQRHFPEIAGQYGLSPEPTPKPVDQAPAGSSLGSQAGGVEPIEEHRRPYTLDDFGRLYERLHAGEIDLSTLQTSFAHLVATKGELIASLMATHDAKQLAVRAWRFGCLDAKRNNKQQNAEHIVRAIMQHHTLSTSIRYNPMGGETYEEAVAKAVAGLTEEDVTGYIEKHQAEEAAQEKAIENPETLEEFRQFVRLRSEKELSTEQRIHFDALQADETRLARAARQPTTVEQIQSLEAEGLELSIKEGFHDRQQIALFIVQLSTRVERSTFNELNVKCKQLGGWYSSFKKADAGFQFKNRDSAEKFATLLTGNADRTDELSARKERKRQTAAERFIEMAEGLEQEAEAILAADDGKLKNTVRRAEMAAGMRGQAYQMQAFARTIRSVAADLENGQAKYLDGVRHKTQLQTLLYLLRRGKTLRNQELTKQIDESEGHWTSFAKRQELDNRPLAIDDVDFVSYPYPTVYRRHLEELVVCGATRKGMKQRSARMQKWIGSESKDFLSFAGQHQIEMLIDYLDHCKAAGLNVERVEAELADFGRLRRANIHTLAELRCALREFLPHVARRSEDDPIQKAEDALRGKELPGFFPTPAWLIDQMLDRAEIRDGDRVLEPSAGKGDILDMIRERHPDVTLHAIEQNRTLQDILEAKGYDVKYADFLEHQGEYDRVVMNPPFEQAADIEHVQHAHELLAYGGRVVAIMSAGPFFRQDAKATAFRDWLEQVGGESDELPEDAFQGVEAFRQTGVRTRLVVIVKPHDNP